MTTYDESDWVRFCEGIFDLADKYEVALTNGGYLRDQSGNLLREIGDFTGEIRDLVEVTLMRAPRSPVNRIPRMRPRPPAGREGWWDKPVRVRWGNTGELDAATVATITGEQIVKWPPMPEGLRESRRGD